MNLIWKYDYILLLITIGTLKFLSVTMNTIDMSFETLFCPDCNVASRMRTFQDWSFFVSFHVLCKNFPIIDIQNTISCDYLLANLFSLQFRCFFLKKTKQSANGVITLPWSRYIVVGRVSFWWLEFLQIVQINWKCL